MRTALPAHFVPSLAAGTAGRRTSGSRARAFRLAGVACAGLLILFGPVSGQVFGHHSQFLREWVMFAGGGIGVLKGNFSIRRPDGAAAALTPLAVLGLDRYPDAPPYEFGHLVMEDRDLRAFAAGVCDRSAGVHLSFHGAVGTRQGWRPLDVDDVCGLPQAPHGPASAGPAGPRP